MVRSMLLRAEAGADAAEIRAVEPERADRVLRRRGVERLNADGRLIPGKRRAVIAGGGVSPRGRISEIAAIAVFDPGLRERARQREQIDAGESQQKFHVFVHNVSFC